MMSVGCAALAGVFIKPARSRRDRAAVDWKAVLDGCVTLAGEKELPRVREIADPTVLGVRPAWQVPLRAGSPPYVRRNVHEELVALLHAGSFVLLIGDGLSGRTRTAYEAVRASVPDHLLVAPTSVAGLRAAVDYASGSTKCVLWLDELDQFLAPGGLTSNDVRNFLSGRRNSVIATLRSSDYIRLATGNAADDREARRVIRSAKPVRLKWKLTPEEIRRATQLTGDERIKEALESTRRFGFAEYIGASVPLFIRWWDSIDAGPNSRGASLVRAAVDCRRLGLTRLLDREMLQELHEIYLADRPRLLREPEAEAWAWAFQQMEGTTSLLFPGGETQSNSRVDVFPHLISATDREEQNDTGGFRRPIIRDEICTRVIERSTAGEAELIAYRAHEYGHYAIVRRAHRHAIDRYMQQHGARDTRTIAAQYSFAQWLHIIGDFGEAGQMGRHVLDMQLSEFGGEDPRTLATRHLMAQALFEAGHRDAGIAECEAVLLSRRRVFGENAPDTIESRIALHIMREQP
ncbi:hypothetical protein ACFC00_29080 [Streptomyces adustus]|uniref:hypothetical protein n=1 Tax=Streptomyces adustus TaxID=1609272 RepID=UPI0035DF47E6